VTARPATSTARLAGVAVVVSILAALESLSQPSPPFTGDASTAVSPSPAQPPPACPIDTLPDEGVCIPVPMAEPVLPGEASRLELLPGRTEDYGSYVTPISSYRAKPTDGGLGLSIAAPARTLVTVIGLEHQTGPARRLILRGPVPRLLTLHRVSRNGVARSYLLSYDGLTFDATAADADVPVGTPLGQLRPSADGAALQLRVRQLRRGANLEQLPVERLLSDSVSLECDPRNVLPPKPALREEGR